MNIADAVVFASVRNFTNGLLRRLEIGNLAHVEDNRWLFFSSQCGE
jgi:hypothetical protein